MRSSLLIKILLGCLLWAAMLSCASKKPVLSTDESGSAVSRAERLRILNQVAQQQLHFTTFSGRAKSKILINKDRYDVMANVRIERDKAIWISVTALMGLEAGRVLITPDSIKIMNRLQSEYIQKPFDYLYRFTSSELDFFSLQQLLVGNVIDQTVDRESEIRAISEGYVLRGHVDHLGYFVQLNSGFRPMFTTLDDAGRKQEMEAYYADYRQIEGRTFPNHVKISIVAEELSLLSEMNYSRIGYDETLDMPFNIPVKYKEVQ